MTDWLPQYWCVLCHSNHTCHLWWCAPFLPNDVVIGQATIIIINNMTSPSSSSSSNSFRIQFLILFIFLFVLFCSLLFIWFSLVYIFNVIIFTVLIVIVPISHLMKRTIESGKTVSRFIIRIHMTTRTVRACDRYTKCVYNTHTRTHTHSYLIPSFNFDDMVVISHCLNRFVVPACQLLTSVPLYGDIYCLRFYLRLTDFLLVSISILFLRIFRLFFTRTENNLWTTYWK